MAYQQSYTPRIMPQFGSNDLKENTLPDWQGGGGQYNMPIKSPYAPVNQGGPGNPGGASNMPSANTKPLMQAPAGYPGTGINPQQTSRIPRMPTFGAPSGGMQQGGDFRSYLRNRLQPQTTQPGPVQPTFGQQVPNNDPYSQYGFGGQSPQLGRYVPPTLSGSGNDPTMWNNNGGYSYNIPNSYGSGQWNQFSSRDVAFPQFGQSMNTPNPDSGMVRTGMPNGLPMRPNDPRGNPDMSPGMSQQQMGQQLSGISAPASGLQNQSQNIFGQVGRAGQTNAMMQYLGMGQPDSSGQRLGIMPNLPANPY